MVNFRAFTSLTYLTQIAFLGGNGEINSSELLELVPRREVLYVGGRYTNITASLTRILNSPNHLSVSTSSIFSEA